MTKLYLLHYSSSNTTKLIFTNKSLPELELIKQFDKSYKELKLTLLSLDSSDICKMSTLSQNDLEYIKSKDETGKICPINAVVYENVKRSPLNDLITYFTNTLILETLKDE